MHSLRRPRRLPLVRRQAGAVARGQDACADPWAALCLLVFEGERLYSGRIYKLAEHTARLFESARILGMKIPYTRRRDQRAPATRRRKVQGIDDGYVRPVVFRGSEMMAVAAQHTKIHVAVAVWQWPSYFDPATKLKGIRLDISDWKRPGARHGADQGESGRPLHDLHDVEARRRSAGLCRRADVRLSRLCRGSDGRECLLRARTASCTRRRRIASSTASRAAR